MTEVTRNPYRGQMTLELADGVARVFHFNLGATVLASKSLAGRTEEATVADAKLAMIWAGFQDWAKDNGQELTLEQVGRLVLPHQVTALLAAIEEAKNGPGESKASAGAVTAA